MFDELVKVDLGKLVSVSLCFFPIVNEFGETGALGCLGKYLEVVEQDGVVGREPHLGELILVIGYCSTVHADSFAPLWCALTLEEACVFVLVPRMYRFSVDGLDGVMDFQVLESFVVPCGFNQVGSPEVAWEEAADEVQNSSLNAHFSAGCGRIRVVGELDGPR